MSRKEKPHKHGYQTTKPGSQPKHSGSNVNRIILAVIILAVVGVTAYMLWGNGSSGGGNWTTTASGLQYEDIEIGTGISPTKGKPVKVAYTGTLENGTKFDSSRDPGRQPYEFNIITGSVIQGWHEGIIGMKVGGKRKLRIPPGLGYGAAGRPPTIPPNSVLLFDVELVDAK